MKTCVSVLCALLGLAVYSVSGYEVVAGLQQMRLAQLDALHTSVFDPASSSYLNYPTQDELAALLEAHPSHIRAVTAWLESKGGSRISVSKTRDSVTATFQDNVPRVRSADSPVTLDFLLFRDPAHDESSTVAVTARRPQTKPRTSAQLGGSYSIAAQKKAYGVPDDLEATNPNTLQMVWGPGTYGVLMSEIKEFAEQECPLMNLDKIKFDTANHGSPGGDNFGEATLDVTMIASFGLNVSTLVSNTNTSSSTEEGKGFGAAFLDFVAVHMVQESPLPQILSLSLGSLSPYSCDLLCSEAVKMGHDLKDCQNFMQEQRQVCMYMSQSQSARIETALKTLALRGVSIFGSAGDGGCHFSFEAFPSGSSLGRDLNTISCSNNMPVYPTGSPNVISVGGTQWDGIFPNPDKPVAWSGTGSGFSWQFPAPAHQKPFVEKYLATAGNQPAKGSYNVSGRAYPDVSAVSVDGTSQSAPTMAGLFAMITDMRLSKGLPPLGNLGPRLYSTMAKYPGEAFQDITSGNSKTSCEVGWECTTGWDAVTGFGRPIWDGMVKHFASDDSL